MKSLGEGRFAWQKWFDFKPDTVIINHQLEFSGTMDKYLDYEKRAYKHEILSYSISAKASNNRTICCVQRD